MISDIPENDSDLFVMYGADIYDNIALDFGYPNSSELSYKLSELVSLMTAIENTYNLSTKSNELQSEVFTAAFDNIIFPHFFGENTDLLNACYKAFVQCYKDAESSYYAALVISGASLFFFGPIGGYVSLAVAVAMYADDIERCDNAYIKCR